MPEGSNNDVIIGGADTDDIKSGDGDDLVVAGRADTDGDGQANIDLIKDRMDQNKDIFEDDQWI